MPSLLGRDWYKYQVLLLKFLKSIDFPTHACSIGAKGAQSVKRASMLVSGQNLVAAKRAGI